MRQPVQQGGWRRLCAMLLASLALLAQLASAAEPYNEPAVKAAFLYRFTGYVDWPAGAVPGPQFTIAVLGSEEVARELRALLAQRQVKGLPAAVRQVSRSAEIGAAQLVYVGPSYTGDLARLNAQLQQRSILVVTDVPNGLDQGATVNFLTVDRRVRFEVSLTSAQRAGLRVSSALLSVAARVQGGPYGLRVPCELCGPVLAATLP